MKALVVFHDHGEGWLAGFLKPGFRHVFCAVYDGHYWIAIDGRDGVPIIETVANEGYDLAAFYRRQDFTVVEIEQGTTPASNPFAIANCVGMIKAVLAIRSFAFTPFALYRHLTRKK